MKYLIFTILLFSLPGVVLALDYGDCDTGTQECLCLPNDKLGIDESAVSSIQDCHDECNENAEYQYLVYGEVTSYSAQCDIGGILTTLAQGDLGEEVDLDRLDYDWCDDGTEICSCLPDSPYPLDQTLVGSVADCQESCALQEEVEYIYGGDVTYFTAECDIAGVSTTIGQGDIDGVINYATESGIGTEGGDTFYSPPTLNVDIPGLEFTPAYKEGDAIKSNYIGEYIEAGYTWVLAAASLLAIVFLMLGGLQYMLARGKQEAIGKAKTRIKNAITGIILLFGAFTIAFMVDPGTVVFDSLNMEYVEPRVFDGDISGELVFSEEYRPPEILCESTYSYDEIATSMINHVAYRYGGKGGPPPYEYDEKIDPNGTPYSSYCPTDNLCLDCSGFVAYVSECKGDPLPAGYSTRELFNESSEKMTTCGETSINGVDLNPGDLLGWNSDLEPTQTGGHVFIHVGGGKVFDAYGSGREPGILAAQWTLPSVCSHYGEILWVLRR